MEHFSAQRIMQNLRSVASDMHVAGTEEQLELMDRLQRKVIGFIVKNCCPFKTIWNDCVVGQQRLQQNITVNVGVNFGVMDHGSITHLSYSIVPTATTWRRSTTTSSSTIPTTLDRTKFIGTATCWTSGCRSPTGWRSGWIPRIRMTVTP